MVECTNERNSVKSNSTVTNFKTHWHLLDLWKRRVNSISDRYPIIDHADNKLKVALQFQQHRTSTTVLVPRHRRNNGLDLDRDRGAINRFPHVSVMAKSRYSCRGVRLRLVTLFTSPFQPVEKRSQNAWNPSRCQNDQHAPIITLWNEKALVLS